VRFRTIERLRHEHSVRMMCRLFEVSAGGYYAWRRRPESKRSREDRILLERIRVHHNQSRGAYGSPRIHRVLVNEGHRCSRKRIERLMRRDGIAGARKRKFRVMPKEDVKPPAPNLLNREFEVDVPNAVWAGDMTYLWTPAGWVFLAVVLDLFSRRVVGWAISRNPNAQLMIDAMARAVFERRPGPGLISHSDQGCQYTSGSYREFAEAHGISLSMSRRGNPWDNAVSEAFFATLKTELGDSFISFDAVRRELFDYIDGFYNSRRIHTSIGWMSPMQYENQMAEVAA